MVFLQSKWRAQFICLQERISTGQHRSPPLFEWCFFFLFLDWKILVDSNIFRKDLFFPFFISKKFSSLFQKNPKMKKKTLAQKLLLSCLFFFFSARKFWFLGGNSFCRWPPLSSFFSLFLVFSKLGKVRCVFSVIKRIYSRLEKISLRNG